MKKSIIITVLSLFFSASIFAQIIIEVKPDVSKYPKLEKDDAVLLIPKDSIETDNPAIQSYNKVMIAGVCDNWDEATCGLDNLAMAAEKRAKARGYNALTVVHYSGVAKKDTLTVIFYRLSADKLPFFEPEITDRRIVLINPTRKDKDAKIDGIKQTLPPSTFVQKTIEGDKVAIKLGGGPLSSSAQINLLKVPQRYFIINNAQMASNGGGIGVRAPTLTEVSALSGGIMMHYFKNNLPLKSSAP